MHAYGRQAGWQIRRFVGFCFVLFGCVFQIMFYFPHLTTISVFRRSCSRYLCKMRKLWRAGFAVLAWQICRYRKIGRVE